MTAPAIGPDWLASVDAEEREALAALGLAADTTAVTSQPERDAQASRLLRAAALTRRELEERAAAREREIDYINNVYRAELERLEQRARFLEGAVCALAMESDFGSKKSRSVGFGSYGRRTTPARIVVEDDAAAIAQLSSDAPHCVRASFALPLDQATQYPGLLEAHPAKLAVIAAGLKDYALANGVDVAGTRLEPEQEKPFAKPELPPF